MYSAFLDHFHLAAAGMADGDSESVGGVVRFRDSGEFENTLDHELDLGFFGFPVVCQGLFDLERGVASYIIT